MMETSSLLDLEGLTDVGLRDRVDMRPTLLRVLTDLYVQKLTHTADEERHYTELAMRLLGSVDATTRAAIAARLAHHLSPPAHVIEWLAADVPEVSAALRAERPGPARSAAKPASLRIGGEEAFVPETEPNIAPDAIGIDVARELNELFFAADADERRLILRNLDIVASLPAERSGVARDPTIGRRLEAAALARKREDFARELAGSLRISREQARRISTDELGEPIVVVAKALGIPRDLLHRILLFVNTAVGHSVERVHALAELYDEMSPQAALDLVAVWQTLDGGNVEHIPAAHQPLLAADKRDAQIAAAAQRPALPLQRIAHREAS
jgi:uncharacterized protein (DUF2336 family)